MLCPGAALHVPLRQSPAFCRTSRPYILPSSFCSFLPVLLLLRIRRHKAQLKVAFLWGDCLVWKEVNAAGKSDVWGLAMDFKHSCSPLRLSEAGLFLFLHFPWRQSFPRTITYFPPPIPSPTQPAWLEEKMSEEKAVTASLRKFPVGWF